MKQAPVLTERDVKRVLQHCAQTAFPDRNRVVFQLGYLSGMRIGEIAALKISDVLQRAVVSSNYAAAFSVGPLPGGKKKGPHSCGPFLLWQVRNLPLTWSNPILRLERIALC